jgi:hypothetical protein
MKFILLALAASTCAPVASIGLRSLKNRSPDKSNEGFEASAAVAVAVVGERELLSSWCDPNTPTLWHPNYAMAWSTAGCTFKADCDSPGYESELACCDGAYSGQVSGACKAGFANPSTTTTKWYADYGSSWAVAGCKSAFPYPSYATTFFDNQLDCCKGAYGGQSSGACLAGLPNSPTMAPVTAGGVGGNWYANYGVAWSIAGCKNTFPYPNYAAIFYSSQLACCKGAFGGQTSNACLMGLPMAPTLLPTVAPTRKPTAVPTSKPTSKPTFEPTVTPSITIISKVSATLTVGARRRGMRKLQVGNANYTNVFFRTVQDILQPILTSKESVLEVRLDSFVLVGTSPNLYLQVVFTIYLKEFCSPGLCPVDKTSTTLLDDKVIAKITATIADGSFTTELKAETQQAINDGKLNATDLNAASLTKLNATATATVTFTTVAYVTTPAPTNVPSKKPSSSPSSNPSSYPSLSTNPSSDPSTNPSSDPSTDPSTNPSSDPSTNPSSDPSTDPSTNPSSFPSTNPSSDPSTDPSTNPSQNPM